MEAPFRRPPAPGSRACPGRPATLLRVQAAPCPGRPLLSCASRPQPACPGRPHEEDGMGAETGRTFLVTGGNTGIGLATATELARRGGRVHIACRSKPRGEAAVAAISAQTGSDQVRLHELDLASLASVRQSAQDFIALGEPLHVLINNAGLASQRGITADGFELT